MNLRVASSAQMPLEKVEMDGARGVQMRLLIGRDHGAGNFAMRQFVVEPGGHTPFHKHNYEHEVYVLGGRGIVRFKDTHRPITAGDVVLMPPNAMHQFKSTGTEPLLFLCMVPSQFNCADGSCEPTPGS
jgi:quercetin dioxygenase-like cupin family protein